MPNLGQGPYSYLASTAEILEAMFRVARGRGIVVNYAKDEIESSFTKPLFPSSREGFRKLLEGLPALSQGYPGLHATHAGYARPPSQFGDEGTKDSFNFFLDIDGRTSLEPARRVAASIAGVLEELDVPHWVKFSGSSGFHVHIPSSAFPDRIDGRPFLAVAPRLFLNLKHFLIRKAGEQCPEDLLRCVMHPKRYYGTSQGVQRLPFSLHEATGLIAQPLADEELERFNPASAAVLDVGRLDGRLAVLARSGGGADGILAFLEEERKKPPPFYYRRRPP